MKKRIQIGCILGLSLGLQGFSFAQNQEGALFENLINHFNPKLVNTKVNPENKESIIAAFCKNTDPQITKNLSSEQRTYNSSQSLFLYILCNNNGLSTNYNAPFLKEYTKTISYKTLKFNRACQKEYGNSCNIALLTEEIITELLNEIFTLKEAEIFGINQSTLGDHKSLNEKINAYAEEKFRITSFCDSKTQKYEKTCKYMKNQMNSFNKAIKKIKIINTDKLYEITKDKKPKKPLQQCTKTKEKKYDLLLCGTIGETNNGIFPLIETIYNEFLWYTLFTNYYTGILQSKNKIDTKTRDEITKMQEDHKMIQNAINETLDEIQELQTTYPIHIGLLAYQEDLLRLRDTALTKLVSPFYTLYHKLRNVQTDKGT